MSFVSMAPVASVALLLIPIAFVVQYPTPQGTNVTFAMRRDSRLCGDGLRDTILSVDSGGIVMLNGAPVGRREIEDRLARIFKDRVERVVFVKADPGSSFQAVAEVIDIARPYADKVALLTQSVEQESGCLVLPVPGAGAVLRAKPHVDVKSVPLWPWKQ